MAGGPDDAVKRASAARDESFEIYETWRELARNLAAVAFVAATVWALVAAVRMAIEMSSGVLFHPFAEDVEAHAGLDDVGLLLAVLIGAALIRGLLLLLPSWRETEGDGMGAALERFHETYEHEADGLDQPRYRKPDFLQAVRRAVMTVLTVGSGGSGGIEAPVVPIGESIGAGWSRLLRVARPDDLRLFQLVGVAAAVATLLDAPFTAALFAAEIIYNARVIYRKTMYSLFAAIIAYTLNHFFLDLEPLFHISAASPIVGMAEYFEVTLVALLCSAPAALGIGWLFRRLRHLIRPFPSVLRPVIGAVGVAAVGLSLWFGLGLGPQHVLGVSEETIAHAASGDGHPLLRVWWALLLLVAAKALATGFTLMAGGSAGALVPAMYLGGLSGAAIFHLLGELGYGAGADVSVFVVAGLASALVAVVQVPLAAVAFVIEVFGANFGPPAIVACVLTYKLARRWRLYAIAPPGDAR